MDLYNVFNILMDFYGEQGWWPLIDQSSGQLLYTPKNTFKEKKSNEIFEIAVGAVLAQNTSWKNAEKALLNLYKHDLLDPEKILSCNNLPNIIRSAGFFSRKSEILKELAKLFLRKKSITREDLLNIKGIGPETADSIMLYAFDKPFFVVDKYTFRFLSRLGVLSLNKFNYEDIRFFIEHNLSKVPNKVRVFKEFHALIVEHSKRFCKSKPYCDSCFLREKCSFYKKISKTL